jgi:hypothetical protein
MIFIYRDEKYRGETAIEIVRAVERDSPEYPSRGGTIQEFLIWSLARMADSIPARELDVSPHLADETVAYNYLCLLDNYGVGTFYDARDAPSPGGKCQP